MDSQTKQLIAAGAAGVIAGLLISYLVDTIASRSEDKKDEEKK